MAVLLIEGFDHLIAGLTTVKGWSGNVSSMQTGRFGGQAARINAVARDKGFTPAATIICGFAFQSSLVSTFNNIFVFKSGSGGTNIAVLSLDAGGHLVVKNSGGTTIGTGTTALSINTWNYIELKVFVNGASGTCELHLNGAVEIASTVGNFGSTNIGAISLNSAAAGVNADYDDIYVCDTSGSAPRNTFLGDVRVVPSYPSADGAHTQWTPSSGTNHFDRVNEHTGTFPDGDTTYVSDATPGDIDTYATDDIDGGATVYGVQVNMYARKDDAAVRQIAPVIRQAGSDNVGATVTLSSTYQFFQQIYNQDPTAADWTPTTFNADEFGIKEIA